MTALIHTLLCRKYERFSRPTEIFARVTVGTFVLNNLLFVQIIKTLWGRVRFQDLDVLHSDFTPWYLPQGITGHDRFHPGTRPWGGCC